MAVYKRDSRDYKPYTIKWISDDNEVKNMLVDGTGWDSMIGIAEDGAKGRSIEIWTRPRDSKVNEELLYSRLNYRRQRELDVIMSEMTDEAKDMVDDYAKNPSRLSGSMDVKRGMVAGDGVLIHENSPLLNDAIEVSTYEDELEAVKSKYAIDSNGMVRCDKSGNPIVEESDK